MRGARIALVAAMATGTACSTEPACPETMEQAEAGDFRARTESTFVGTGVVVRFVPAPDVEFRGYDIHIDQVMWGDRPDTGTFLLVPNEIVDVHGGDTVLIVAEPTTKGWVLEQGTCVALQPIVSSELGD